MEARRGDLETDGKPVGGKKVNNSNYFKEGFIATVCDKIKIE